MLCQVSVSGCFPLGWFDFSEKEGSLWGWQFFWRVWGVVWVGDWPPMWQWRSRCLPAPSSAPCSGRLLPYTPGTASLLSPFPRSCRRGLCLHGLLPPFPAVPAIGGCVFMASFPRGPHCPHRRALCLHGLISRGPRRRGLCLHSLLSPSSCRPGLCLHGSFGGTLRESKVGACIQSVLLTWKTLLLVLLHLFYGRKGW